MSCDALASGGHTRRRIYCVRKSGYRIGDVLVNASTVDRLAVVTVLYVSPNGQIINYFTGKRNRLVLSKLDPHCYEARLVE